MPHDSRASIAPPSPGSDANDFFGGTRAQLSYDAMPNAHWNDRSESGLRTYDVGMSGPQMQFSVGKGPLPPTDPGAAAAARPAPPVLRGSVSPGQSAPVVDDESSAGCSVAGAIDGRGASMAWSWALLLALIAGRRVRRRTRIPALSC